MLEVTDKLQGLARAFPRTTTPPVKWVVVLLLDFIRGLSPNVEKDARAGGRAGQGFQRNVLLLSRILKRPQAGVRRLARTDDATRSAETSHRVCDRGQGQQEGREQG